MDAARSEAGHHLVALGYLVMDDEAEVGEGGVICGDRPLVTLAIGLLTEKQTMIDEVGGEQLVYGV